MNDKQKKQIKEVMKKRKNALISILLDSAADMVAIELPQVLKMLKAGDYTISNWNGITKKILDKYGEWLQGGGTMCVEEMLIQLDNGKVVAHPVQKFVPWLDDMEEEDAARVIAIVQEGEKTGMHPHQIASQLKDLFGDSEHNAMTAARTEAQKIRTDARIQAFLEEGVEYLRYVTAGDERVRPSHRQRNGKIYRIQDAPWLGEYNCRCTLVPADYQVLVEGKHVEVSDYETVEA